MFTLNRLVIKKPKLEPGCRDYEPFCSKWIALNECVTNRETKQLCPKGCGVCGQEEKGQSQFRRLVVYMSINVFLSLMHAWKQYKDKQLSFRWFINYLSTMNLCGITTIIITFSLLLQCTLGNNARTSDRNIVTNTNVLRTKIAQRSPAWNPVRCAKKMVDVMTWSRFAGCTSRMAAASEKATWRSCQKIADTLVGFVEF